MSQFHKLGAQFSQGDTQLRISGMNAMHKTPMYEMPLIYEFKVQKVDTTDLLLGNYILLLQVYHNN